jgi:hypothetical protein
LVTRDRNSSELDNSADAALPRSISERDDDSCSRKRLTAYLRRPSRRSLDRTGQRAGLPYYLEFANLAFRRFSSEAIDSPAEPLLQQLADYNILPLGETARISTDRRPSRSNRKLSCMSSNPDSSSEQSDKQALAPNIGRTLSLFVSQLEALKKSQHLVLEVLTAAVKEKQTTLTNFMAQFPNETDEKTGVRSFKFSGHQLSDFVRVIRDATSAILAQGIIPRSLLVSAVSIFDAFIGSLVKACLQLQPGFLNASERSFTFSELNQFSTLDDVKEHVIEKEIESLLRSSHSEQFRWMESKFSLPLTKGLNSWPTFLELTERRNLFVHADGRVSSRYLQVCGSDNIYVQDGLAIGKQLEATPEYLEKAHICLSEIGIKLAHVLWRKLRPNEIEEADKTLNQICYDYLVDEEYDLALIILNFATGTLKKWSNEDYRRMLIINLAIAYKWLNHDDKCLKTLDDEDWTASALKFRLAVAVLRDKFNEAAILMKEIGAQREVKEESYRQWPLFKRFRETSLFLPTFRDVFGKEFVVSLADAGGKDLSTYKAEGTLP